MAKLKPEVGDTVRIKGVLMHDRGEHWGPESRSIRVRFPDGQEIDTNYSHLDLRPPGTSRAASSEMSPGRKGKNTETKHISGPPEDK